MYDQPRWPREALVPILGGLVWLWSAASFGLVGFFDVGFAGESFSDMDSASGAGIGARIKLKALGIGAVRLDYGWELSGETGNNSRFHFFLGEMF